MACWLGLLARERGFFLSLAHFNHGLRAHSAKAEALAQGLAERLNAPFVSVKIAVQNAAERRGQGLEDAGRFLRYREAARLATRLGACKIAVAHTMEEQAESVLINILRGGSAQGILGARTERPLLPGSKLKLIRPMLEIRKDEAIRFLKDNRIVYFDDPMNRDPRFLRSRIRHELLPKLIELHPKAVEHFARLKRRLGGLAIKRLSDKRYFLFLLTCSSAHLYMRPCLWAASPSQVPVSSSPLVIAVHYPKEGASVGAVRSMYLLGNVQPPSAQFKINGEAVVLYKNGAFLAYQPVAAGTFTFHCEASWSGQSVSLNRRIQAAKPLSASSTDAMVLEEDFLMPKKDAELRTGDWLNVQVKTAAGLKGFFKIKGIGREVPFVEVSPAGLYQGACEIQQGDETEGAEIRFVLKGKAGKIKGKVPGLLTILKNDPRVAEVNPGKFDSAVIRTGPGRGYYWFLPSGTRVLVDARSGDETRLRLSDNETGWTDSSNLEFLPAGTPPPSAVLSMIRTQAGKDGGSVHLVLGERIPYLVEQPRPDMLKVKLYGTYGHVNWMIYAPQDHFIRQTRWRQETTQVVSVEIELESPLCGYEAFYEPGGLRLELRAAPTLASLPASSLKDRTIVLDPGHSPSDPGRVTPMGSTERELNFKTALALKKLLEQEGAKVVMTREADLEVSLTERVRIAVRAKADAFISLHNNALPDGDNPFDGPRGFSVFYYNPLSLELARHIHRSYQKNIPLADEGLRYGNLMVARMTAMPAVLVESAYFIYPEQEEMLMDSLFQERLAQSLLDGLRGFFEGARRQYGGGGGIIESVAPDSPAKTTVPEAKVSETELLISSPVLKTPSLPRRERKRRK